MSLPNNRIEILKIKSIKIKGIEIEESYVTMIDIFESLTQPGITGYISIQDYQGIKELANVFDGDEIEISFGVDGFESEGYILKFSIFTDEGSKILPQQTYNTLRLGFCSKWMVDGFNKLISKPYKNQYIHDIIYDILTNYCDESNINFIEPTLQKLDHFLSPRWTPVHIIKYLMSFALNKNKIGGYICWTDLKTDKINISTLDYLMKGNLGQAANNFMILPMNQRYQGRIINMDIESSFDSIKFVNAGIQNTVYYGFNFDNGNFYKTKEKITDLKNTRLSKKLPINSKYKSDANYSRFSFSPLFPSTDNAITDEKQFTDLIDGDLYNHYSLLSSDIFKVNIETLGDTTRKVGQLVKLEYPSQSHNNRPNDIDPNFTSSNYLIREIRHTFSSYIDYKQYITLAIDGYQKYDADLITW